MATSSYPLEDQREEGAEGSKNSADGAGRESLLPPLAEEPPQEGTRQQKWSLSLEEGAKRDYYHRYVLVDPERGTLLSEYLTIIVIELQRPIDKSRELTPLDRWVEFTACFAEAQQGTPDRRHPDPG